MVNILYTSLCFYIFSRFVFISFIVIIAGGLFFPNIKLEVISLFSSVYPMRADFLLNEIRLIEM